MSSATEAYPMVAVPVTRSATTSPSPPISVRMLAVTSVASTSRRGRRTPSPWTSRITMVILSYFSRSTWVRNGKPPTVTSGSEVVPPRAATSFLT
jgi:hypothetical protein